ncbi:MAG: ATPase [Oscillospiraceae bacterium]|jgi:vacuolar-type H+-ATPase subunit H|nr:ATPase [Oscillospiraceae bacterium]
MSIEEILEIMDENLDKAMQVPFSNKKSLVDVEKMRDLVEEIRLNMPNEVKQAKKLVQDRKTIVEDARAEADVLIKKAEERAKQLASQQEVTKLAQQRANEIMSAAQQKSNSMRSTSNEYIDNMLSSVEELLSHDLVNIKKARSALKANK